MDYVFFNVSLPEFSYLEIENYAKEKKTTKNEIIVSIILSWLSNQGVILNRK